VHVSAEPRVIGEIPARMIGIIIDYDRVRIPQPAGNVCQIEGRNAPVEVIEPEPRRPPALKMKHRARPESAREVAVFERMSQMVLRIIWSGVVPHPFAVRLDMGGVRMSRLVLEVSLRWSRVRSRSFVRRRRGVHGLRPMRRNVTAADSATAILVMLLGVPGNRGH